MVQLTVTPKPSPHGMVTRLSGSKRKFSHFTQCLVRGLHYWLKEEDFCLSLATHTITRPIINCQSVHCVKDIPLYVHALLMVHSLDGLMSNSVSSLVALLLSILGTVQHHLIVQLEQLHRLLMWEEMEQQLSTSHQP